MTLIELALAASVAVNVVFVIFHVLTEMEMRAYNERRRFSTYMSEQLLRDTQEWLEKVRNNNAP